MGKAKIQSAKPLITKYFSQYSTRVFTHGELAGIMLEQKEMWALPASQTTTRFIEFLLAETKLKKIVLESETFPKLERFIWRNPSVYAIAQSIKAGSYLSHGSAVFLHGLTDLIPKTIHLNFEQSPKPSSAGKLLQENIDRAFSRPQRATKYIYRYDDYRIIVTNGKFTNRLEVSSQTGATSEKLDFTRIERTLIDITVRPAYAGGVFEVLEVYKKAKDMVSVSTLLATLKKLAYIYPYHQSVGFYLEKAGYPEKQWSRFMNLGLDYDFYLAYQLPENKKYDRKWRLYYPDGL